MGCESEMILKRSWELSRSWWGSIFTCFYFGFGAMSFYSLLRVREMADLQITGYYGCDAIIMCIARSKTSPSLCISVSCTREILYIVDSSWIFSSDDAVYPLRNEEAGDPEHQEASSD